MAEVSSKDFAGELLEESISKAAKAVKFDDADEGDVDTRGRLTVENEKEIQERLDEIAISMQDGKTSIKMKERQIAGYASPTPPPPPPMHTYTTPHTH